MRDKECWIMKWKYLLRRETTSKSVAEGGEPCHALQPFPWRGHSSWARLQRGVRNWEDLRLFKPIP